MKVKSILETRNVDYRIILPADAEEVDRTAKGERVFRCQAETEILDLSRVFDAVEGLSAPPRTREKVMNSVERTLNRILTSRLGRKLILIG